MDGYGYLRARLGGFFAGGSMGFLTGDTSGVAPGAGQIGEVQDAQSSGFVTTNTSTQTLIASKILPVGVWNYIIVTVSDNNVTQTGYDALVYLKGTNSGEVPKTTAYTRYFAGGTGFLSFVGQIVIATADADKTLSVKAIHSVAAGTVAAYIFAVRAA